MRLEQSTRIVPGTYRLSASSSAEDAVLEVRGDNITIDFAGAVLDGGAPGQQPDQFQGVALRVSGGRNITIRNLTARGYKIGLLARDIPNLRIIDCDFSYNYRPRLKSTLQREDTSDWLSFHHNERDQWLRYGAGIYLHDCDRAEVSGCTITGGFNGLMMTRCDDGQFWNNNFSFNSGVGIGLYRSNRNRVMHNRLDWNVRGYSHGVYHRGQDSAAILVYEQSCDNVFAYNSATHSGDGFFLWAGQTTMDTGQGGSNDNVIYANDFSFAPTNGIEVTFSRNRIVNNTIHGCDHGIWGGYSYQTTVLGNSFKDNRIGIAIEHGQDNLIGINTFQGDKTGIRLWQNPRQDPDWGYPKLRDTRSRDYRLIGNTFADVGQQYAIRDTIHVRHDATEANLKEANALRAAAHVEPIAGAERAIRPQDHPRGRQYILVDEWGPYDFRSPRLWPREKLPGGRQRFEILGPRGKWKLLAGRGVSSWSAESGDVPGELIVGLEPAKVVDLELELEYLGAAVMSPLGERFAAGAAYRFGFSQFMAPIDWTVSWFRYDDETEPRQHYERFRRLLQTEPLKQEKTTELAYAWHGPIAKDPALPSDRFATLAEGVVDVPAGEYRVEVTSDDGVRVWLDDQLVIDNWTWHVPTTDVAIVRLEGRHRLRVEHFEIDGFATLQLRILPQRAISGTGGTP